jgi:hypothetical protein
MKDRKKGYGKKQSWNIFRFDTTYLYGGNQQNHRQLKLELTIIWAEI